MAINYIKTLIFAISVTVAAVAGLFGFSKLPKKVTANSVAIDETSKNLDLFIMEQRTIQKSQNKRENLMLELIRQREHEK